MKSKKAHPILLSDIPEHANAKLPYIAALHEAADERGEMAGLYLLGMAYATGSGVEINYQEALRLFSKSAAQEYPPAMDVLGDVYFSGAYGLPKTAENDAEALKWWRKSAELGGINNAIRLATAYYYGQCGVQQSYPMAYAWFSEAALHGNHDGIKHKALLAGKITMQELEEAEELAKQIRQKIETEVAAHNLRHANYRQTGKLEITAN